MVSALSGTPWSPGGKRHHPHPQCRLLILCWHCITVSLLGQVASPSTSGENIRDQGTIPWKAPESWLYPAPAFPAPSFPQNSCFWVRKLIFQPSVRWSVRGGRSWKRKKEQPWSRGWKLQIPQGFNCLQSYRPITVENCLLAEFRAALGPRGLLAAAACEPLYLSNAMFPKSVVLKWWERAKEGDSCPGYTDNEIHRNQISPKHANNIPAGACLSSRAGFVWFLQWFFFLMSLFLLFSPNVFIMCLLWRLLGACQHSGDVGGGRTGLFTPKAVILHIPPATGRKRGPSFPLPQPCPDNEPNTKHRIIDLFRPTLREIPILMNESNQPPSPFAQPCAILPAK